LDAQSKKAISSPNWESGGANRTQAPFFSIRFVAEFLGSTPGMQVYSDPLPSSPLFYFRVTIFAATSGYEHQTLMAFYAFQKKANGLLVGERRALYVF
jgi:hypothetical protein